MRRLEGGGRIDEVARMLGGEAISDGLRESAREMLADRAKGQAPGRGVSTPVARAAKAKGERRKS